MQRHYRASGLKEKSRIPRAFNSMKQEPEGEPIVFIFRVDHISRELGPLGKTIDGNNNNLAIRNGLSPEYEVERKMLEGGEDLTKARIEAVLTNQYDRSQEAQKGAGVKALAVEVKRPSYRVQMVP